MRDKYKALMLASFKDGMEIVADYNEWCEAEQENGVTVPPVAVPQIALALFQSRVMDSFSTASGFDVPEFDDKMYE